MATTTVRNPSIVTAGIRLLTSTSTQISDNKPIKYFEEMLLSKMKALKSALLIDTNFDTLRSRLAMKENERLEFWKSFLEDALEIPEEKPENTGEEVEGCELDSWKLETRWKFVELCLHLMLELKCLLQELATESKNLCNENTTSKGPQNPKLNLDALSVSDQKAVLTCVQFIVSLGIYPNLLPGVGIPVEKRSGYFHLIKGSENELKNEKKLYECVKVLLDCIKQPSIGSIILSRHLGDILTGLIQICYAPVSSYHKGVDVKEQEHMTGSSNVRKPDSTIQVQGAEEINSVSSGQGDLHKEKTSSSQRNTVNSCSSAKEWQQFVEHIKDEHKKFFLSASQREDSWIELQRLVDRVYQPIIIRELLMIQGSSTPKRQQKNTTSSGKGVKKTARKDDVSSYPETPKWFKDNCGQLLSARLMRPNGVQAVLRGILDNTGDLNGAQDWRKCDMIARLIANCPSQASSEEDYYSHIAPQVLNLLHIKNVELGKHFVRVASSVIKTMVKQNPTLAKKYLLDAMMAPLLMVTEIPGKVYQPNLVVVDEESLTVCIEDIHKVFVAGSDPQTSPLMSLASVIHPVFELFCFTRKGISHLRSSCQDILLHFLKHAESSLALKTLYILVYRKSPPLSFGLLTNDEEEDKGSTSNIRPLTLTNSTDASSTKDEATQEEREKSASSGLSKSPLSCVTCASDATGDMPIKLMRREYTFRHGDSGGIIIKSGDFDSSESFDDVLGRLTGDAMMNHKVQALCLVELLVSLKNDGLSGEFFLHLMKELTNIVKNAEEEAPKEGPEDLLVYDRQAHAHQQILLILHLLGLMCDKLGPSILKDVHQMLAFIKSTLHRGCVLCESEDRFLEGGLVTETLTMAFGMLSAIIGGAVKVELKEKTLLQELLPLLDKLSTYHSDKEVKEMANDLRIAIATHGAVWSQQMKEAANNIGKTNIQENLVGDEGSSKKNTISSSDAQFDEAFAELCDPLIPVRGYAMITLSKLLHQRHPKALSQADTLLKIFTDQLSHDDSYIYLAAIQGMVALSAIKTDQVLPYLAREFATCRSVQKDKAQSQHSPASFQRSPETKMKLGEALVKAVRECGDLIPRYSQHLMSSLLSGVRDPDEFVRASSLSNIGDLCKLLRFSVGPIIQEVFSCLSSVLKTDQSDQVRRAAVLVITLLLQGLGKDTIQVVSSNLKEIYHLLKTVEVCDKDETTRVHAQVALGQLDTIMREFLFPKQTFTKRIQVLP